MRSNFVAYEIDSTPYTFKRRGSSPAEQNHSSIVSYLGKDFSGELPELLSALLERHAHKNKKKMRGFLENLVKWMLFVIVMNLRIMM